VTIRLYDTLAREKVDFVPRDPGRVSMYVCGPTVYDAPHVGHGRIAVSDLGGAAVAVIDRDHLRHVVKLDRGGEVVPIRLAPILERLGDDTDRGAGDDELAELSGQPAPRGIAMHRLLQARIDAAKHHRLVVAFGRQHHGGRERGRRCEGSRAHDKVTAAECAAQQVAATSAGGRMDDIIAHKPLPRI